MMETKTARRNVGGLRMAAKTHCPHGHAYEGNNLIVMIVRDKDGNDTKKRKRQCWTCKHNSHRRSEAGKHKKPSAQAAE